MALQHCVLYTGFMRNSLLFTPIENFRQWAEFCEA